MKICSAVKNKRRYPHLCAESKKTFAQGLNLIYQTTVSTVLLRLDDEVVRIVVGFHFGVPHYCPHYCSLCGGHVDEFDTHGLSCKMSAGRLPRHAAINTIVKMSLARAQIPSALETVGLCRSGLQLIVVRELIRLGLIKAPLSLKLFTNHFKGHDDSDG